MSGLRFGSGSCAKPGGAGRGGGLASARVKERRRRFALRWSAVFRRSCEPPCPKKLRAGDAPRRGSAILVEVVCTGAPGAAISRGEVVRVVVLDYPFLQSRAWNDCCPRSAEGASRRLRTLLAFDFLLFACDASPRHQILAKLTELRRLIRESAPAWGAASASGCATGLPRRLLPLTLRADIGRALGARDALGARAA